MSMAGKKHSPEARAKMSAKARQRTGDRAPHRTHRMTATPTYYSWANMVQRCTNPHSPAWHNYGGRGIAVCDRWRKFDNFFADMGQKPDGATIERIDNDGGYEPGNVRWATRAEQARNRRMHGFANRTWRPYRR